MPSYIANLGIEPDMSVLFKLAGDVKAAARKGQSAGASGLKTAQDPRFWFGDLLDVGEDPWNPIDPDEREALKADLRETWAGINDGRIVVEQGSDVGPPGRRRQPSRRGRRLRRLRFILIP